MYTVSSITEEEAEGERSCSCLKSTAMSRPHHSGLGLDLGTGDIVTKIQPLPSWTYCSSEGAKRVKRQLHRQHLNREGSVRAQC